MTTARTLAALALGLGLAAPVTAAETPAPAADRSIPTARSAVMAGGGGHEHRTGGEYRRAGGRHHRHMGLRRPTYAGIALRHRAELALNAQQVEALEKLRTDAARASIQRRADLEVAGLDLMTLRRADPVDLAKVEAKVREMEKLRADGQIAGIRTDEQGKAQLTADQREKLKTLMTARWQQWRERRQPRSEGDQPRPAADQT
jgi:Spy/CpxP family protein refolding chaperone